MPAFEELVTRHAPRVIAAAYRVTRDRSLAEDAAQETFWKAYRALATYREQESLGGWLRTIAIRTAVDICRRRRPEVPLERIAEPRAAPPSDRTDDRQVLEIAMRKLRPRDRAILVLIHLEERPVAEVAATLAMTATAVRVRAHRARRKLRAFLTEGGR